MEQDAFVAAQTLHDAPRLGHDLGRQRRTLRVDRQRRQHHARRVATDEERLEEVLDREQTRGSSSPQCCCGKRVEALAVEDGLRSYSSRWPCTSMMNSSPATASRPPRARSWPRAGGRTRRRAPRSESRAPHGAPRACTRRARAGRSRPRRASAGTSGAGSAGGKRSSRTFQGPATGLARDRRGRDGVVFAVRARAERDGQLVVAHVAWQTSSGPPVPARCPARRRLAPWTSAPSWPIIRRSTR